VRNFIKVFIFVLLAWTGAAGAAIEPLRFDDPAIEARYKHLIEELRCLVCQNQSLADSDAPLAADLRKEVYEMLNRGQSDREIIDFLVARYGDFVLYRPPVRHTTYFLWAGPFLFLVVGAGVMVYMVRRHTREARTTVSDEERKRLDEVLASSDKEHNES